MALGGFASVAAALGRPLGDVRRQRFLALLFLALTLVLQSFLPVWLGQIGLAAEALWRLASVLALLVAAAVIGATVVLPLRRIGYPSGMLRHRGARFLVNGGGAASVLLFPLNAVGIPVAPGFALYYASLMLGFAVGFVLFADVVLLDDGQ
jgi:hypothetical protein